MKNKKLTFLESLMLVAGAGIGTGILTIPYAIDKIGVFGTLVALVFAYAASAFMYLIIADLTRNSEKPEDLLAILNEHLFSGNGKKALNIAFLVLLVLLLLENLVVYILCAGNVLTELLGLNDTVTKIIFYALASIVIIFGIKGMGVGEKLSMNWWRRSCADGVVIHQRKRFAELFLWHTKHRFCCVRSFYVCLFRYFFDHSSLQPYRKEGTNR